MFNPARASEEIRSEFIDYIMTTFSFADKELKEKLKIELEQIISNGPYVELNKIFKSGKSIKELIEEGILSKEFENLEKEKKNYENPDIKLPIDRPLYYHQEQAIRKIVAGDNLIISTGTGSGKTNCFLIPVLNELLKEKEEGTLSPGIRAIFIYPMNALANDQIKNLRKILVCYPSITFGVYNGATEEQEEKAINFYNALYRNEEDERLRVALPNEKLSREEMKMNPPHILFTNYSMLEHLLFRPKDDVLFSNSDFRYVILDEAHVYAGATGIETAILLRKLKARISTTKKVQFILTSATLGGANGSDDDIVKFGQNLCGESFDKKSIIRSQREEIIHQKQPVSYHKDIYFKLAENDSTVVDVLDSFNINHGKGSDDELLYDFISSSDYFYELEKYTGQTIRMDELAQNLNCDKDFLIALITLAARSKKNGKLLIDARYHFFVRCLEGCFLSLSNDKNLYLNRKLKDEDVNYQVIEIACCTDCGKYAFVGHVENDHLLPANMNDTIDYFYPSTDKLTEIEDENDINDKDEYYLCPHCGYIKNVNIKTKNECEHPHEEYLRVFKAKKLKIDARCGSCHTGRYRRFFLGYDAATAVLATSLYDSIPNYKYDVKKTTEPQSTSIFKNLIKAKKAQKIITTKQFLSFSDSRQQAAKFACYLEDSYQEFLRRRSIYQIISVNKEEIKFGNFDVGSLVNMLKNYYQDKRIFDNQERNQNPNQQAWVAVLNEIARFNSPTSLTSLGYLQFSYAGLKDEIVSDVAEYGQIDEENARMLCNLLIFEIVKDGAISASKATDIGDAEREYIFYSPKQRYSIKEYSSSSNLMAKGWMPKKKNNEKYYNNYKLYCVKKIMNCDDEKAIEFLSMYYDLLMDKENNEYSLKEVNIDSSIAYVLPATSFIVNIPEGKNVKWFRCKKCGRVSQFHINHHCMTIKCNGEVEEISPEILHNNNHFARLYEKDNLFELRIKEHTAQLSKVDALKYQEQFVKKEINALSCSTTFEMGVDVGSLETVFLRDIPPLPSNYTQRAGRAGRSINSAAFVLTYAKLSSHDLTYYKNPLSMIEGEINPPLFKIDNEKIIRRHIYSIALALYFKKCYRENNNQYDGNKIKKFILEKGYVQFIDWLNTKPLELKELIKKSIPDIDVNLSEEIGIDNFGWLTALIGDKGVFTILINNFEQRRNELIKLIEKTKKDGELSDAARFDRILKVYEKRELVEFLARGNVLPRYGFPVNTVELEQYSKALGKELTLSRDLQVAIAEYAPSSEIIADGKMYTSRYIKKTLLNNNKSGFFLGYFALCENCKNINFREIPIAKDEKVDCIFCGQPLSKRDFKESIEPRSGFVAEEEVKPVPLSKQEKNYKSEDYYISDIDAQQVDEIVYEINGNRIVIQSTENDSLMIKSNKSYYVCPLCGYALSHDEDGIEKSVRDNMLKEFITIEAFTKHKNLYGMKCDNMKFHRYYLHHVFKTDVIKLCFKNYNEDLDTMDSVMYAILYSISDVLNIERKDIKGCLSYNKNRGYDIIIYDSVPGGAGHSRRILGHGGYVLQKILEKAYERVSSCNCEPSCYNCLRSYENQKKHEKLDRHKAEDFLLNFVGDVKIVEAL